MRKLRILFIVMLFVQNGVLCQVTDTIEVGYTKSAYLIFPTDGIEFDIGSEDVAVKNFGNRLVLQVIVELFEETNLFVQCGNKIYMFIVVYKERPSKYLYDFSNAKIVGANDGVGNILTESPREVLALQQSSKELEKDSVMKVYESVCDKILEDSDRIMNRGVVKYKIGIYLKDIVIYDDKMFFEFEVRNSANIPYILDFYQYRVRSTKRRIKGESFQEVQLKPILEYSKPARFEGKSTYKYVIVMDKFVLTKNKKMVIEHWEDNGKDLNIEGGRKIDFDIFSRDVLDVRTL